jgi:hypothetical protein
MIVGYILLALAITRRKVLVECQKVQNGGEIQNDHQKSHH